MAVICDLHSDGMNQAVINTGFDLRRYVIKQILTKPSIIITHVEDSGTASVIEL